MVPHNFYSYRVKRPNLIWNHIYPSEVSWYCYSFQMSSGRKETTLICLHIIIFSCSRSLRPLLKCFMNEQVVYYRSPKVDLKYSKLVHIHIGLLVSQMFYGYIYQIYMYLKSNNSVYLLKNVLYHEYSILPNLTWHLIRLTPLHLHS